MTLGFKGLIKFGLVTILTTDILISKCNQFIFVPKCIKIITYTEGYLKESWSAYVCLGKYGILWYRTSDNNNNNGLFHVATKPGFIQ